MLFSPRSLAERSVCIFFVHLRLLFTDHRGVALFAECSHQDRDEDTAKDGVMVACLTHLHQELPILLETVLPQHLHHQLPPPFLSSKKSLWGLNLNFCDFTRIISKRTMTLNHHLLSAY